MTGPVTPGRTRLVVFHSCGHEMIHDIGGPPKTRKWQAEQRGKKACAPCRRLAWETETAVDNATYAALADEQGLPELEGTDRQVAWAITLRGQLLDSLPEKLAELNRHADRRGHDRLAVTAKTFEVIRQVVVTETSAAWWIREREHTGQKLVARHRSVFVTTEGGGTARALLMWAGG